MSIHSNTLMYCLQQFPCPCGWSGDGSQAAVGEITRYILELDCPLCKKCVATVEILTDEQFATQGRENWELLGPEERSMVHQREAKLAEFERRGLTASSPLPDIAEDTFILDWETQGFDTVIRHGRKLLWSEPLIYEGSERFAEVAKLLSKRYGPRLLDLRPSEQGWFYLLGDDHGAPARVARARLELARLVEQNGKMEE